MSALYSLMRTWVSQHLNTVLCLSVVAGFLVPGLEQVADIVVPIMLGIMVFFLCAKLTVAELYELNITQMILFYCLRFIALPIGIYYIVLAVKPEFALGAMLIALAPVGVTTPALVSTLGGAVAAPFILTIASNLLAPAVIPASFLLINSSTEIEVQSLSYTLAAVIIIPAILFFSMKKVAPQCEPFIKNNSSFIPVVFLGTIIAIVIAKQRDLFFTQIDLLLASLIVCACLFACFYLFGWFFDLKRRPDQQLTYALCSGASNNALAISLALLYFPPTTSFFVIVSQLTWVLAIPVFNTLRQRPQRGEVST